MRCYFHLVSQYEEILDKEGIDVLDLDHATIQALAAVNELRLEASGADNGWGGWSLNIVNADGMLLHSIPLNQKLH